MIEPLHIPILLKAIDFVFDEGRKILEERRERRRLQENPPGAETQEPATDVAVIDVQQKEEIKQDLLASKIDEISWQKYEWEVESLVRQLESHTQSYYILKEQSAKWGSVLVPPVIVIQMNEKETAMLETIKRLEIVLSKVYNKDILPDQ